MRRAVPSTVKDAEEPPFARFCRLNDERPAASFGLPMSAGIMGVQVCPAAAANVQSACPSIPRLMNHKSSAMSGGATGPKKKVNQLVRRNEVFRGVVVSLRFLR